MNNQTEPLTAESFKLFVDVLEIEGVAPEIINDGNTGKFANLAEITLAQGGQAPISIYRSAAMALPFQIQVMQRHPLGSQAFMPLHNRPFLVVVAPAAEQLDFKLIQGFFTNGEQGVNFHKGTWHHYQLSLDEISDYLVIDRSGPGNNRVEQRLENTLFIEEFR